MAVETDAAASAHSHSSTAANISAMLLDTPGRERQQEPTSTRLMIKQMVLENFKSYAGRVEIGPFHKVGQINRRNYRIAHIASQSFSSIVGPNGSGKSNVIDALLFVFGFKAKKMRQEKLSGLIHSSRLHPDLEYCTVEIHFQEIIDLV